MILQVLEMTHAMIDGFGGGNRGDVVDECLRLESNSQSSPPTVQACLGQKARDMPRR